MSLQPVIFILLFGGLQGLLFSLFLVRRKLHRSAYIFLLLYMCVMILQITLKVMSKVWLMKNWLWLYCFAHHLPLLYGPLIYLFMSHLVSNKPLQKRELLHFLPLPIIGIVIGLDIFAQVPRPLAYLAFNPYLRIGLISISLITYHLLAYRKWREHLSSLKNYFSDTKQLQMSWARQFVLVSAVTCLVISFALFALYVNYPRGHEYRYAFLILTGVIYWLSYVALTKPSVFSVIKGNAPAAPEKSLVIPQLTVYKPAGKYVNSGLSSELVSQIQKSLDRAMHIEKLYLLPELTISNLADKIKCSRHHLSQVLNENLHKSFYDYVNAFRVEEAKKLLVDTSRTEHKIAAIAYDSGFNSLSTFNDVFRKIAGQTPSQFRKQPVEHSHRQRV
jgi:AraC-like DNA-binding protein